MTSLRFEDTIKDRDVEIPVDLWFHRRLAFFLLVRPFHSWSVVTPTHLTLLSLVLGLVGAWACLEGGSGWPMGYLLGAALVLASVVADCADGMLARARGGGTTFGMLLDGVVDLVVGLALWFALAWPTARLLGGWWAWPLMFLVLLSIVAHVAVYDGYKNQFLAAVAPPRVRPEGSGGERAWRRPNATVFERFAGAAYELVYGGVARRAGAGAGSIPGLSPERFRAIFRPAMRRASWLGLGAHLALMYVAAAACARWPLAAFWVGLVGILGLGNLWTLLVVRSWNAARRRALHEAAVGGGENRR